MDPSVFGAGVGAGVASDYITEQLRNPEKHPTHQAVVNAASSLRAILAILAKSSHEDIIINIPISPLEYVVPDYDRDHLSLLVPSNTTGGTSIATAQLIFNIPGVGQLTSYPAPGWIQLDLPPYTRISTGDSNNYSCILSFRDDPLGSML